MLDENHPGSANIFKASQYIDAIKGYGYEYAVLDFDQRQEVFQQMILVVEELAGFSEIAFPESYVKLALVCGELSQELHTLKAMNDHSEAGTCKVCGGELNYFKTWYKGELKQVPLCKTCGRSIIQKLTTLERLTGVWAI